MKLTVHYLRVLDKETEFALRTRLRPEIHLPAGLDLPPTPEYHILIAGRPQREQLTASPNLRALIIPWSGLPDSTAQLMLDFPQIAVHNLHHNALPVAEHALTLLLAAAKRVVPMDRALRAVHLAELPNAAARGEPMPNRMDLEAGY